MRAALPGASLALATLKRVAAAKDRMSPAGMGTVILIYHRVGRRTSSRVDLPEWLFDEQMARIADRPGVTDLDRALSDLKSPGPGSSSNVVVTFDDGTADFVEVALPILVRHGVPATLYVATDFVESGRQFPQEGRPVSWSALQEALSTGLVTIGSHTHAHHLMNRVEPSAAGEDLDRSIGLIGDRLGVTARHFAYPKAILATPAVEVEVRSRFDSAALAGTRANRHELTDPYRLARSPVQVDDGIGFFERKVDGGMGFEDDVRRIINRRRLAGKTY